MRALRIAALGLLPLAGACWMEPPNLRSTGGGYAVEAAPAGPSEGADRAGAADPGRSEPSPPEAAPEGDGH